jgi:hypothetical protein
MMHVSDKDTMVLTMWDLLFAHGLRSDLVDFTCIAMLLRIRWQCCTMEDRAGRPTLPTNSKQHCYAGEINKIRPQSMSPP